MIINQSPTIFVEKAEVIKQKEFKKKQYILTLKAPEASNSPGSAVCDASGALRVKNNIF